MTHKFFKPVWTLALLIASVTHAHAGVVVGGTRVVYEADKREVSLPIRNIGNAPFLIQAWADNDGELGDSISDEDAPFIVTPPLYRLDPTSDSLVRIIYLDSDLPADRESVYWLNVKSIPAMPDGERNVLQIAIKTRIKLFYRPGHINRPSTRDYESLTFSRDGDALRVSNPSPYYITFFQLKLDDHVVNTTNVMVPPKSYAYYSVPADTEFEAVSWEAINDFGGKTNTIHSYLR